MDADVLVVGAGIAGLTTAARLQDLGLALEVVEQAPELRAAGAGIMLHPNALAHLGRLSEPLVEAGRIIERQLILDPDGSATVIDWRDVWPEQGLPVAIHRRRLAELLLRRLAPGTVRWSSRPLTLEQDGDRVSVRFSDGAARAYRLVIGADGINSWVRQAIDPHAAPRYLGHTYWRTTVSARPPLDFAEWRVWRSARHAFGAMPIGEGRVHVFLQASLGKPVWTARHLARGRMLELAAAMGPAVSSLVSALGADAELEVRPAYSLLASRWARGRVGIVGDAAHAVSPATTQGGALAIEDAAVMAEEAARHGPAPQALAAFERRRHPRVQAFARLSRLHVALIESLDAGRGSLALGGRETAAGVSDGAPWFRRLYAPLLGPA
jgi:2-polyprenyl-6-methoxyphenol hydroxylase-like FAD-dependent oxidoreductase